MNVSYNGINFLIPNPAAGWNTVSKKFLDIITAFFKRIGVIEVYVTWVWNNNPGSYHNKGSALDIHYLKYRSGTIHYFTRMMKEYSSSSDDSFYSKVREYIAPHYNYEYISPATVDTSYEKASDNKYRNYSRTQAASLIRQPGYEINKSHLDHLHFAVDTNPKNRKYRPGKSSMMGSLTVLLLGYGIYRGLKWKKII